MSTHFIGNRRVAGSSGETIPVLDPSDGQVFAHIARGNSEDIRRAAAATSPPTSDHPSTTPKCRPSAAIGMDTFAWAMAITMARVAAIWRLDAPRWSIMARVATGAAKLTKLI